MKTIGFTYDADYHCEDCAFKYIKAATISELDEAIREWLRMGNDEVMEFVPTDSEENDIHPIFDTDEWYANDIYEGLKTATLNCSDCGAELDTWESND